MNRAANRATLPIAVGLMFASATLQAAWSVDPLVQLQSGWSSNPALETDRDDGIVNSGSLSATVRNITDNTNIQGRVGLTYRTFSGVDNVDDRDTQFLNFKAAHKQERFAYRLLGQVRRDQIFRNLSLLDDDLSSPLDELPIADGDPSLVDDFLNDELVDDDISENAVRNEIDRTRMRLRPTVRYRFNERTGVQVGYYYQGLRFDSEGEAAGLRDSDSHELFTSVSRALTPRNSLNLVARYSELEPDDSLDSETTEVSATFNRSVSERWSMGLQLGVRRVESDFSDDNGPIIGITAAWRGPRDRLTGSLSRSVQPGPFGEVVEADQLLVRYRRQLDERLVFSLPLRAFRTDNDGLSATANRSRTTASVSPSVTWAVNPSWGLGLLYAFNYADRDNQDGSAVGHEVSAIITYRPRREF